MKLFSIPNLFTLGNLLCGCLAIVFAFEGNLVWSAYLVGVAAIFDFLDGFLARKLNQHSPIGKELDSLADMVTFGVLPGVVMFEMLKYFVWIRVSENYTSPLPGQDIDAFAPSQLMQFLPYVAFMIPLFSALRLAKFNIDTRQSESFIGVPTPAIGILVCSIPLIIDQHLKTDPQSFMWHSYSEFSSYLPFILTAATILFSFLLISEIPLFALKFKNFGWKGNEIRWIFLGLCVVMLVTLKFVGIPLTIVLYILMSVVSNVVSKKS